MNFDKCDRCKVGERDVHVGQPEGFFADMAFCNDCAQKHGLKGTGVCKVCYRDYHTRPNDMCDNYLHWQAYVYQLEAKGLIKKSKEPPQFKVGDRVQIADERSSRDYGRFLGVTATVEEVIPHARNEHQEYRVMPNNSTRQSLRVRECDLEKIER